ncbi:hypothetical protein [Foetidibacter luteolus]|uniref:hypothetical protein n=1 Tax=Foetidibacter luteolus TaxID=2608880 RepID=UPI00129A4933|nr:hypothetical protein [Foetidibacter luteolus]
MNLVKFLIIFFLVAVHHDLFACKCLPPKSVKEEMNNSDAVLVGRVLKKEVVRINDSAKLMGNDSTGHPVFEEYVIMRYEIAVEKMYKGRATKSTVFVYTGSGGGDCGFHFELGGRYIIYANTAFYSLGFKFPSGENIFYTSTCTRTAAYTENEMEEIKTCLKN